MNQEIILQNLRKGLKSAFSTRRRAATTLLLSTSIFFLMALSRSIGYSTQMFLSGKIVNWLTALYTRVLGVYIVDGYYGLFINTVYAVLIGVTLTNFHTKFRSSGVKIRNLTGIAPGFIAAGCAGCGIGLLSLLGIAGGVAVLPLQGALLRISGMALLLFFIVRTGDPETCSIAGS
ncbi:MAG: hypothetical protein ABEK16_02310 [Candidatus Nanohalobium sp.]